MKSVLLLILIALAGVFFVSCGHSNEPDNQTQLTKQFELKYQDICTAPARSQSMMLTVFDNKIFIYGCYGLMIYDTTAHTWQRTTFPIDTIGGRWDGALAKYGNNLYVFGAPGFTRPNYYKAVKMDLNTLKYQLLPEQLPITKYDCYPAYAQKDNKLLIIYPHADSVYLFDLLTEKGKFVAKNIMKDEQTYDVIYDFGKYEDYLYIYNEISREFKRISLNSYLWESITIPLEAQQFVASFGYSGAVFDGILMLYTPNYSTCICYDIQNNKWGYGNYNAPNSYFFETRFTTDTEFYFLSLSDTHVWKVTLKR